MPLPFPLPIPPRSPTGGRGLAFVAAGPVQVLKRGMPATQPSSQPSSQSPILLASHLPHSASQPCSHLPSQQNAPSCSQPFSQPSCLPPSRLPSYLASQPPGHDLTIYPFIWTSAKEYGCPSATDSAIQRATDSHPVRNLNSPPPVDQSAFQPCRQPFGHIAVAFCIPSTIYRLP